MILKVTVFGLVLVLIAVIALSYYMNKEGFEDITLSASESLVNSTSLAAAKAAANVTTVTNAATKANAELAAAQAKADAATKAVATATPANKVAAVAAQTAANKTLVAATKAAADAHTAATKAATDLQAASKAHTDAIANAKALEAKAKANEAAALKDNAAKLAVAANSAKVDTASINANNHVNDVHEITNHVSHPMGQPTVTLSDTGYAATELHQKTGLLQDIQKIIHNELLANRSTQPVHGGDALSHSASASISQGNEYNKSCMKKSDDTCNASCPDMSQYIKKDSIPCAGCNLDY